MRNLNTYLFLCLFGLACCKPSEVPHPRQTGAGSGKTSQPLLEEETSENPETSLLDHPESFALPVNHNHLFTPSVSTCNNSSGSVHILMYHKFDEPYPSTSVTLQQFKSHLEFFSQNGYKVVPLKRVLKHLWQKIPFPGRWVVITIDDAYLSFLKAKVLLEQYSYPYTLFVNTEAVDKGFSSSLTWDHIRNISRSGLASLGAHSHTHRHLVLLDPEVRKQDISKSVKKIYQNTGVFPDTFSYPFGEASPDMIREIANMKISLNENMLQFYGALSTQSGPVGCSSNIFSLPRFAMNENYGTIDSAFTNKLTSHHLPVKELSPNSKILCLNKPVSHLRFSTKLPLNQTNNIQCYSSGRLPVKVSPTSPNNTVPHWASTEVLVSLNKSIYNRGMHEAILPFRVNCTVFNGNTNAYYWFGKEFFILKNHPACLNHSSQ